MFEQGASQSDVYGVRSVWCAWRLDHIPSPFLTHTYALSVSLCLFVSLYLSRAHPATKVPFCETFSGAWCVLWLNQCFENSGISDVDGSQYRKKYTIETDRFLKSADRVKDGLFELSNTVTELVSCS
jgi:hypothetical protein